MSIQDDHFDLESHFEELIAKSQPGTPERQQAEQLSAAYQRVWELFVDTENDNERYRPVVGAVTTIVRHVIEEHYQQKSD